jgi:hypothetical protein
LIFQAKSDILKREINPFTSHSLTKDTRGLQHETRNAKHAGHDEAGAEDAGEDGAGSGGT